VASVVQNGAALASVILLGDVIVQIDNVPVTDSQSLGLAEHWSIITVVIQSLSTPRVCV
jgi:C-terminal processing protease CtpA/Prc